MSSDRKFLAWHFLPEDRCLANGDGRLVVAGKTLSSLYEPHMCRSGMHASINILHALKYAPGCTLCRVEVWGDVKQGSDKIVGRYRKCLWMGYSRLVLIEFAQWCADRATRHAADAAAAHAADAAAAADAADVAYAAAAHAAAARAAYAAYAAYTAYAAAGTRAAARHNEARRQEAKLLKLVWSASKLVRS